MYLSIENCPFCCGVRMTPVWFNDEEYKLYQGRRYKTGRKRKALSHFECIICGNKEAVDDSFDGEWR
jgi:hypothetical protein